MTDKTDPYLFVAEILMTGEPYINTSEGMLTPQSLAAMLQRYFPGHYDGSVFAQWDEAKYQKVYDERRKQWWLARREQAGHMHMLFRCDDDAEADYFLQHPEKIELEYAAEKAAIASSVAGGRGGWYENFNSGQRKAKPLSPPPPPPKPNDPEKRAAQSDLSSDLGDIISGG